MHLLVWPNAPPWALGKAKDAIAHRGLHKTAGEGFVRVSNAP
jgi:hypothetical protein